MRIGGAAILCSAPDGIPDAILQGTGKVDPEEFFDGVDHWITYMGLGNVYAAKVSKGTIVSIETVDSGITTLSKSQNGPEFGLDQNGWAIYYNKEVSGHSQVFQAVRSGTNDWTVTQITDDDGIDKIDPLPSQDPSTSTTWILCISQGLVKKFDIVSPTSTSNVCVVSTYGTARPVYGTTKYVACNGLLTRGHEGALIVGDFSTGAQSEVLNNALHNYDPAGWIAPEYGHSLTVCAQICPSAPFDATQFRIYADNGAGSWSEQAVIAPPDGACHGAGTVYMYSPEPQVIDGKSYLLCLVKNGTGTISAGTSTESEIWLYNLTDAAWTNVTQGMDTGLWLEAEWRDVEDGEYWIDINKWNGSNYSMWSRNITWAL